VGWRYRLFIGGATAAATSFRVTWGAQLVSDDTDDADMDPAVSMHQNWYEWGHFIHTYAINEWRTVNGNGDDGFRTVRAMRKLSGVDQSLRFVIVASANVAGMGFSLESSVAVKLP
jgi:hypothetical protein